MEKGSQPTSFISNFSLGAGDTVEAANGFPLSSDDTETWRTCVTAYRPGGLRGKGQPLRKTLTLIYAITLYSISVSSVINT